MDYVIETESLSKIYISGEIEVNALKSVDLKIKKGEFIAIAGPSGSGKTTFLNLISGLDSINSGIARLAGKDISLMTKKELSDFRRDHIGFIFQAYNLIPVLTAAENIEYIMLLQNISPARRRERTLKVLQDVDLSGKENRFPSQLSGGQQQRVAIARAIVSNPDIILADEPTANLDSETGSSLLDLMHTLNRKRGITFVFATHDPKIMDKSDRLIIFKDGKVDSDIIKNDRAQNLKNESN
ncbi:MAG: ABC transporter ATP-binding protein [Elusimicrobia bacterium]|nr:ABC transporter ATP-binding protein [Elusimicrobiota bacterium]